jgi:hypothetical protein
VSRRLATEAGVKAIKGSATMAIGAGGELPAQLGYLRGLRLGSIEAKRLQVAIVDLTHLSAAIGTPIDGVVGYNFLRHYSLVLDYPRRELRLQRVIPESRLPQKAVINGKRRSRRPSAPRRKTR